MEQQVKNLIAVSLLAPIAAQSAMAAKKPKNTDPTRPNVIIILADDLGYGDLGCYGAKNVQTPNVDRLAQQGIRFTDTHAVAATSTPSRYSILTGEYAWRRPDTDIAAGNAGMIIKPGQYTMADMFKSCGYRTCAIGKWHLGLGETQGTQDWNAQIPMHLGDIGFDHHYIMAATADRVPCVFINDGVVANFDPSAPIEVSYKENFPGEPTGKDNPELCYNLQSSVGHNQSIVNGIGRIGYMRGGGKALWKDENIADSITLHAIDFIKENKDRPFFIYFATNDVHVPRFPHQRFRGKSDMGLRGDAIVQFDWSVGQIMETLDKLGIADNTIILLSSDNGPVVDDGYKDRAEELLNGHKPAGPWRGNKYSAFEGGTQVPAIVRWPKGIKGGQTSNALTSQIDWMASLGSIIGARVPQGGAPDSQNYASTLTGANTTDRPYVIELAYNHVLSVRTNEWKYIEPSDGPKLLDWAPKTETGSDPQPQLYNIKKSKWEAESVAPQHPQVVYDMQNILRHEREKSEKHSFFVPGV